MLIHRITLSKYAGDGKTKLRGFDSPGAQFTAQSIVEKLDISPLGKSLDLLVKLGLIGKLVLMANSPRLNFDISQ